MAALLECASRDDYALLSKIGVVENTSSRITEDLIAFSEKDPAARSDPYLILKTYTSFSAVLHYRIANWVENHALSQDALPLDTSLPALLSRRGKMMSGAEIHFRSVIGERLVLNHGFGTVIGETSVIGNDCYILGGVTLGARGISRNPVESRHPVIGDRVEIGAFASVFGRVTIGDDVFIGPNCIVTDDIPSGAKVKIKSSLQVVHSGQSNGSAYA